MTMEIVNILKESNKILLQIAHNLKQLNDSIDIDINDNKDNKDNKDNENNIKTEINDAIDNCINNNIIDVQSTIEQIDFVNRQLFISSEITEETAINIVTMINNYNTIDEVNQVCKEKRLPIKIYINTVGGDLYAALSIVDAIQLSKTPVFTIVIGTAFSSGCFISMVGHKRFCYPNASFMFHEGCCIWEGDAHKFHSHEQHYQNLLKRVKKIVIDNSNIDEEYYNAIRKDDNWWDPQKALKLQIVDKIMIKEDINNE